MTLSRPYKRLWRPISSGERDYSMTGSSKDNNLIDPSIAPDRQQLVRAYHSIQRDLASTFEYIDPHDKNLSTFSHRTYALLLRACTEFENNCQAILSANNYQKTKNLNITDYQKLDAAGKFSDYELYFDGWNPTIKVLRPFENWKTTHTLPWYSAYNDVKHNRSINFPNASLDNAMTAIAAVFALIVAQFDFYVAYEHQLGAFGFSTDEESDRSIHRHDNCMFSFRKPSWKPDEKYGFDWNDIRDDPERFIDYPF